MTLIDTARLAAIRVNVETAPLLARLTAFEIAVDLRRIDNDRLRLAAIAAHSRGDLPAADELGSWWWLHMYERISVETWAFSDRGIA